MSSPASAPNILILHADQHRWDCLGLHGNPDIATPNIDSLADEGVTFNNSFCPYPVCTPSRYSLLTGQYVHQHLGWNNHCTLPSGIPTVPRLLRDAGYRTRAVGKMHFTPTYLDVGFQEMVLAEQDGPGRFDDDYHRWLMDEGLVDRVDITDQRSEYRRKAKPEYWETLGAHQSDLDEAHHSTTWIAEQALESIRSWEAGGNLLMTGFIKPHHPFDPPAGWDSRYDPESLSLLPGWLDEPLARDIQRHEGYFPHRELTPQRVRRAMAGYYATISQIDFQVGRIVSELRARDLYDNTLIIYTSDHGDYMGFHHLMLKGNHLYDPVIKVPLIVKFPGSVRAGERTDSLVNNLDVAPTLLEAAGVAVPSVMTGKSLADDSGGAQLVFAESEGAGGHPKQYMVRSKSYKLLLSDDQADSSFFDLDTDPYEMHNRIDEPRFADEVEALKSSLLRWALFDSPSNVHLDPVAPVIRGENLPADPPGSARAVEDYFRRRMSE